MRPCRVCSTQPYIAVCSLDVPAHPIVKKRSWQVTLKLCWSIFNNRSPGKKSRKQIPPWFVAFADFQGVNISSLADSSRQWDIMNVEVGRDWQ